MDDEVTTLAALGRFLEKINSLLYSISQKRADANFSGTDADEILWYEVLRAVHAKHRYTHSLEDSYKLSVSVLAEVMTEGGKTDRDSLIRYCVAEHGGRFLVKRNKKLVMQRGPRLYEGAIEEEVARKPDDDEVVRQVRQQVAGVVAAVLSRMRPRDADILARRFLNNRHPTVKQLAREVGTKLDAMKKRLMRAEQRFSKVYTEIMHDSGGVPPIDTHHASPHTTHFPQTLGRTGTDF